MGCGGFRVGGAVRSQSLQRTCFCTSTLYCAFTYRCLPNFGVKIVHWYLGFSNLQTGQFTIVHESETVKHDSISFTANA